MDHRQQANELRQLERRTGKQKDSVDHPPGLHDDIANALCGSLVMASRGDSWKLFPPSPGYTAFAEDEKEKMDREAVEWLTGQKRKHKDEDEDFDPAEWDVDAMSQEQIKKELSKMEEK